MATPIEELEKAVSELPADQLRVFRAWYEKFDAETWDEQLERDLVEGRLDAFADSALADHRAGRSRRL